MNACLAIWLLKILFSDCIYFLHVIAFCGCMDANQDLVGRQHSLHLQFLLHASALPLANVVHHQ